MKKEIVNSIINYIEDSLEVFRVDIDCLVKYSGYSRRQLQIIFREYAGLPLGEYIRLRRICRGALDSADLHYGPSGRGFSADQEKAGQAGLCRAFRALHQRMGNV